MKLQEASDERLISAFVKIRDQRSQRRADYEAADADDRAKQDKIEAEFLRRFHERGSTSTKSDAGTAYINVTNSATVADRDVYFNWIIEDVKERLCFLEARVNKTSLAQYKEEHDDIPPGVNYRETQSVGFRRS